MKPNKDQTNKHQVAAVTRGVFLFDATLTAVKEHIWQCDNCAFNGAEKLG